jgi:hypothetical protein
MKRTTKSGSCRLRKLGSCCGLLAILSGAEAWLLRIGRSYVERSLRPVAVVVIEERAEHPLGVPAVADQLPVEALGVGGADEAFCNRGCFRRSHWRSHDFDALASEDGVLPTFSGRFRLVGGGKTPANPRSRRPDSNRGPFITSDGPVSAPVRSSQLTPVPCAIARTGADWSGLERTIWWTAGGRLRRARD